MRNADILTPQDERSTDLGERQPCVLGFTRLEWSFRLAELGREREEADLGSDTRDSCFSY